MNQIKNSNAWSKLEQIDLSKDRYIILQNPECYFEKYLSQVEDRHVKIAMQTIIYLYLRSLFRYFTDPMSIIKLKTLTKNNQGEYYKMCRSFLTYTLDTLTSILEKQEDSFLDVYTGGSISKETLEKVMLSFESKKDMFKKDRINIEERINEFNRELETIKQER